VCLAPYAAQQLDAHGRQYELVLKTAQADQVDERVAELLDTLHRLAEEYQCTLEAWVLDPVTQRRWMRPRVIAYMFSLQCRRLAVICAPP
jgi:hypothetical protein